MISQQTRVAVLFRRLGPYHHARLVAAGKLMDIFGVEACGMEDTYAWEKVEGAGSFTRITLTDRQVNNREWKQRLHRQMQRALSEAKPQVVAVPGWSFTDALSALSWCLHTNTPAVMMSESTEWDERRVSWKEWLKRRLIHICAAALAGGTPHLDYMLKLGMPVERIFLGYDAVDNKYFSRKADEVRVQKSEGRNKYGLPEKYFLASARFVEKKNLPRLLQAYARYRVLAEKAEMLKTETLKDESGERRSEGVGENVESRKQPGEVGAGLYGPGKVENQNKFQLSAFSPWSLVLLGDGPLKSDLCHLISDLGLQHFVLLPGFKQYDDLPVYYGLAGAFIHASTTEQWGLVVNEAMASGLPVLVSNRCGCATDLVKDGVNGFTFDPYNVEQLASLMLKISAFNFPLSEFGAESTRLISNWGPERFASGLKSAAKKAMEVGPKRASLVDSLLLRALLTR